MIIDIKDSVGSRERYSINKNGKKHGFYRYWVKTEKNGDPRNPLHLNCNLLFEANFKNEKHHGASRSWHSNGNLRHEANFKNGKFNGLFRSWDSNGNLRDEKNFKNGIEA